MGAHRYLTKGVKNQEDLSWAKITRAISIRQPFAELILQGKKKFEFRSTPTRIRERVYIYASLKPGRDAAWWKKARKEPGELPVGRIVGSVEIVDCQENLDGMYAYQLRFPRRITKNLTHSNQPMPKFWKPRFKV